ncbi:hypothetical protein [Vibrio sinaloensis]|uniref:hypothetical protein n=1 Tax=Photobacterium sp. (strain ATCC 43367) TaxID=379097 RepID=UPI002052F9F2|nr:hypothetical protein [Vibrio sinaloensis]UPQ88121.1 hypothetical protein MTO69_00725 [Vibrio sinaloensis]
MNIVFCFPYRGVGGVSLLFSRIANYLSKKRCVFVVDYKDGFMAKNIEASVKLIEYDEQTPAVIPENTIVVFQAMTPWSIFSSLTIPDSSRIFFWHCHPYNLVPSYPVVDGYLKAHRQINLLVYKTIFRSYWNKANKFLEILSENNSIAFMDKPNKDNTQFFFKGLTFDSPYLRIPSFSVNSRHKKFEPGLLRLGWIGRITDFKVSILKHTLLVANKVASKINSPIEFTVVGSGEYLSEVKGLASSLTQIKVEFIEHIDPKVIDDYIFDNIDLMFAMGTSALESAKLGVPTVLLDFSYKDVPDSYAFVPLFLKQGESLGEDVSALHSYSNGVNQSLASMYNILHDLENDKYQEYSDSTVEYFNKFHEIGQIAEQLVTCLDRSRTCYNDLKEQNIISDKMSLYMLIKKALRG